MLTLEMIKYIGFDIEMHAMRSLGLFHRVLNQIYIDARSNTYLEICENLIR